ncbi:signal recognition particle protein [bacterium]|nr:signal recognition particle protein [bacterium]
MFEKLSDKIQNVFDRLRGKGRLNEKAVEEGLREIRMALLEADVNYKVAKDFIARVKEKSVGEEILKSLTAGQQIVRIVRDELTELLGGETVEIELERNRLNEILLIGLQGCGKTTMAAKMGMKYREDGWRPLLVALDIYRPAAVEQLQKTGAQANVPVFAPESGEKPMAILSRAHEYALENNIDILIADTAGRLTIDDEMMAEVEELTQAIDFDEVLLVVDAMTGQEAVTVAETFNSRIGISGCIMTKLDGDARGGAALSVRSVTGVPIKLIGTGEGLQGVEVFYPERMSGRIIGMGDVLSLIEKVEQEIDQEEALRLEKKIHDQTFDFEDFLGQLRQLKKMGPLENIVKMIPGMQRMVGSQLENLEGNELSRVEAIICSMTAKERHQPDIINSSRKNRIARGSGTKISEVNAILKQFKQARKMMKKMGKMSKQLSKKGINPSEGLPFDL